MAKLSVVICVYNTDENLFEKCLSSVFESSQKDLEVIVVDDGSTKDYSKILKKFIDIVYIKTENRGTLCARMTGVKNATAPYVCFVDSDDMVSFNYFEASVVKAEQKKADIVLNDWAFMTERTSYVCSNDSSIKSNFFIKGEWVLPKFFKSEGREHSYYVLWNKIFRREILMSAMSEIEILNLKNKLVFAEDTLITFFSFTKAKIIANTHLGYYYYRIHADQEITVSSEQKLENHVKSMALVFNIIEQDLKKINRFDELESNLKSWKSLMCSINYAVAKKSHYDNLLAKITEIYEIKNPKKVPKDADKPYAKHKLLPLNISEIDTELKKIYYSNKHLKVYAKKNSYAFDSLVQMKQLFAKKYVLVANKTGANVVLPKEKNSLKLKIIHNEVVYKFGMILFPKGSKLRQKLKSKI